MHNALTHEKIGNYAVVNLAAASVDESSATQLKLDLADLCESISWDDQIRVVVLSLEDAVDPNLRSNPGFGERTESASLVEPVARLKQPVIAAIQGDALGLALELALACDIRIGADSARFGLPQIREGAMPCDGGTQRLPRLIGHGRAMHMILTGELIRAEEACRIGLIHRVVPASGLMHAAFEMAREMAEKSPVSLRYAKEVICKGMDLTLDQGIGMEMDLYLHLFSTADRVEGIEAYKQKRKPNFRGE